MTPTLQKPSEEKKSVPYGIGITSWKDSKHVFIRAAVLAGDVSMVVLGYLIAFAIRFFYAPFIKSFPITKGFPDAADYLKIAPVVMFMWALAISWQGAYRRIQMQALDDGIRLFRAALIGSLFALSTLFLYRDASYSRLVFLLGGVLSFCCVYSFRQISKYFYLSYVQKHNLQQKVLVVGDGRLANSIKKILEKHKDRTILLSKEISIESLKRTVSESHISEVLLAHPKMTHTEIVQLANCCEEMNVTFRLIPDILEIRMGEVLMDESLGIPMLQIKPVSLHGTAFLTKRIVDVAISILVLGILSIPLTMIAIIIKLTSPGPVFYKHERMGYHGRPFYFMKFRTMVKEADDLLEDLKAKNDRIGPAFKMKNDPRITPFGLFLRRYSLDEIPQLINVLRGEMSLVGPRPQVLWEAAAYDDWAKKRLNVLPGITGLWQVSGRAELTYEEMIDLDIYYIEHWSFGLDIKILLKTPGVVLFGEGAY